MFMLVFFHFMQRYVFLLFFKLTTETVSHKNIPYTHKLKHIVCFSL
ncbi:hypothetical protein M127_0570 [Bacteroides fragilis str. S6L5]|nr:hypothetical protein M127_0570 [Bacteroides fragilis str. S6L5]